MSQSMVVPSASSSLQHWLDYWDSIHVTAIDLGLERIRPVAAHLELLKPDAQVVTVAGTNGKGSTTTTIAAIYQAAHYKVGLYQSPHIYRFNERIKLNGVQIDDATLIGAFVDVERARIACNLTLSFFEATTLAAFLIFKQQECDVWVLEVGLGGRLDAVNLIDPDVAVITNIGLDHTDWLGNSIEEIAFEKAGIMRPNIPVVFSESNIPQAIIDKAHTLNCQLLIGERDYVWRYEDSTFYYASPAATLTLPVPQLAMVNVAAAISAVLLGSLKVTEKAIQYGVAHAHIAGRFEVRQFKQRTIILDVAHNVHGVKFLLQQLEFYQQQHPAKDQQIHLVFSMLTDKDISGVAALLKPFVAHWYIAPLTGPRAASVQQLQRAVSGAHASEYRHVSAAFAAALKASRSQDIIIVCGSFHTLEAVWESLASWQ